MAGGENGDLLLTLKLKPSKQFELQGIDLITTLNIMPWDAALGHEVSIDTLDGRISVKIPRGIQTDSKVRIAGKGYLDGANKIGDLYIKIKIMNPNSLTKEMEGLYKKLKNASRGI